MTLMDLIEAVQAKESTLGYDALAPPEKLVFDVAALEAEVNNGGFDQYFSNSAGDRASALPDLLKAIGASTAAAIVQDACHLFPGGLPSPDRDTREEQLAAIDQHALEDLDRRFLAYPEPIGELTAAYFTKHLPSS